MTANKPKNYNSSSLGPCKSHSSTLLRLKYIWPLKFLHIPSAGVEPKSTTRKFPCDLLHSYSELQSICCFSPVNRLRLFRNVLIARGSGFVCSMLIDQYSNTALYQDYVRPSKHELVIWPIEPILAIEPLQAIHRVPLFDVL